VTGKPLAAHHDLVETEGLHLGAHRAVKDQDPLRQERFQQVGLVCYGAWAHRAVSMVSVAIRAGVAHRSAEVAGQCLNSRPRWPAAWPTHLGSAKSQTLDNTRPSVCILGKRDKTASGGSGIGGADTVGGLPVAILPGRVVG